MKNLFRITAVAGFVLALAAGAAQSADVTAKGVHLCCGACVQNVQKALKNVGGVSLVSADRNAKIVTFSAKDAKAAQAGVNALAKAGFHGSATIGKRKIAFPVSGAKKGVKAESVTLHGVHLCCGGCVDAARKAVQNVAGVATIDVDRNAKTLKLSGKGISVVAAVAALNKGGFHGSMKPKK